MLAVDLIIIVLVWLPLLAIRHQMAPIDDLPGWAGHLAWAALLAACWLTCARLDRGLSRRGSANFGTAVGRLLWPVILTALSPQLARGLDLHQTIPVTLMLPWSIGVLLLMSVARCVLADGSQPPAEPRSAEARFAFRWAGGGLILLALLPLLPYPRNIIELSIKEYTTAIVYGTIRLGGLIGVAVAIGLAAPRALARARWFVMKVPKRWLLATCAGLSVAFSGAFAYFVLDHMPHVQDEIAFLFQAKNLAAGRVCAPAPPMPEAFDYEYVVIDGDRWYGKYFPGPSVLLAMGVLVGAPWVIHPLLSAVAIVLLFLLADRLFGDRVGRLTVLLAVVSPFWVLTFASNMSHPGSVTVLLVFAVLAMMGTGPSGRWYHALLAGLAWGCGTWFRPYTALLLAVPYAVYVLLRIIQRRAGIAMIPAFLVGAIIGVLPLLAYNKALTGHALETAYAKWAPSDRLGFGDDVGMPYWPDHGRYHTPMRGIAKMTRQLESLAWKLLGWPRGTLLLMLIGGLCSARRWRARLILAVGASLPIGYLLYHFGDSCYGPRYYAAAMPAYLMLVALGLGKLRRALQRRMKARHLCHPARYAQAGTWALISLATLGCLVGFVPDLVAEYGNSYWTTDPAVRNAVHKEQCTDAIVFVESTHYRSIKGGQVLPDYYGAAFWMNSPTLDDPVIFARDLDHDMSRRFPPNTNLRVLGHFSGRKGYRFIRDDVDGGHLEPIEAPAARAMRSAARR